jgi:hypothetical protein
MFRYRTAVPVAALAATLILTAGCNPAPPVDSGADPEFAALQDRGAEGMGVDQYASTHLFDALADGGRIEFQYDSDDPEGVAQIRTHLREIQVAFQAGDFSTPAFVHDQEVPGTAAMAARREHIEYRYQDLPRGGELRLVTTDQRALEAIRDFMAFQRADHRAGGMDHGAMGRGTMDHGAMGRGAMGDSAFATDMSIVHELVANNRAITRSVEHLPNGIRTLTESSSPAIAGFISAHVASMEQRLEEGEVFNLFSHTLPTIFESYDRIHSEFEYLPTGVAVVQTSDDPALVAALQAHAAEVTELVDEGMVAMMRGMMESRMQGMMRGGMHGGGAMHQPPTP